MSSPPLARSRGDVSPLQPHSELALKEQLSSVRGLLALAMVMTERRQVADIVHLAVTATPSLVGCQVLGLHLHGSGWQPDLPVPRASPSLAVTRRLLDLGSGGGRLEVVDRPWAWAFALPGVEEPVGHLVVAAAAEPTTTQMYLLQSLAQQTGIAISNARLHASHLAANEELERTVAVLSQKNDIHDRFTRVAMHLEGYAGIVRALHELTGLPALIEDEAGGIIASAGPADMHLRLGLSERSRALMIHRALRSGHPIHAHGRLVTVVRPRSDVLGVISVLCPGDLVGGAETIALEHAATVLAIELARLHSIAETELRLGVDLTAELISGAGEGAASRARVLGHDLGIPHRVLMLRGRRSFDAQTMVPRVQGALSSSAGRALVMAKAGAVVAIIETGTDDDAARHLDTLREALADHDVRVGIGSLCRGVADYPRSYREARLSLKLAQFTGGRQGAVTYDDLGVYQFLSEATDPRGVETFVQRWLGPLLAYDAKRNGELTGTLATFLDSAGSYDATAARLGVGRSTVRYRIGRASDITALDLHDPDTRFQLQLATRAWLALRALTEIELDPEA